MPYRATLPVRSKRVRSSRLSVPRPRKNDLAIDQVRKLALRCVSAKSVECPAFIALGATEPQIPRGSARQ